MIFTEEDLNSLNAIAGLLASFGCDSQAGCQKNGLVGWEFQNVKLELAQSINIVTLYKNWKLLGTTLRTATRNLWMLLFLS